MSDQPVKTDALAWSGAARRVADGQANIGAVEGFAIGVAEARPSGDSSPAKPRGTSAFTERPSVEVRRMEEDAVQPIRPNGRVKLDRY